MKKTKADEVIPPPDSAIQLFMYRVAAHVMCDVVMNTLIILNMIPIIFELASDEDAWYMGILKIINYVYCCIYVAEAIWKVRRWSFLPVMSSLVWCTRERVILKGAISSIILSAPKCFRRHFIFHRKCVSFE